MRILNRCWLSYRKDQPENQLHNDAVQESRAVLTRITLQCGCGCGFLKFSEFRCSRQQAVGHQDSTVGDASAAEFQLQFLFGGSSGVFASQDPHLNSV